MILRHQHNFTHGCDCCCCNLDPLLFDLYPGAAAGYSVRRLSLTYEGAAMQVRRSSDNTTLDIGFDGEDLDTASLLAFAGAGSAFVSIWYDQSGFGRNAIQATAANQPRIVNAGVLDTQNVFPAMVYDGSNDRLTVPTSTATFKFLSDGTQNYLAGVARVGNSGDPNALYTLFGTGNTGSQVGFDLLFDDRAAASRNNCLRAIASRGVGTPLDNAMQDLIPNTQVLFSGENDIGNVTANSRAEYYVNGSFISNLNTQTTLLLNANSANNLSIGSSGVGTFLYTGSMQEIIIYDSNQSANRLLIEGNINAYYNIY